MCVCVCVIYLSCWLRSIHPRNAVSVLFYTANSCCYEEPWERDNVGGGKRRPIDHSSASTDKQQVTQDELSPIHTKKPQGSVQGASVALSSV